MAIAEWAPERRRPTFSFYVTAHRCKRNPQIVETAVDLADAVTVAGPPAATDSHLLGSSTPISMPTGTT